ncbi:MAG: hypothetical protein ACOCXV_00165 [Bacteroidota bacterium]
MKNFPLLLLFVLSFSLLAALQSCRSKQNVPSTPQTQNPPVPPVPDINDDLPGGVPAMPGTIEYKLPDGYILLITIQGDEHEHIAKTADGFRIIMNPDGYYEYAIYDDQGLPQPTGIVARNPEDRTKEEWRIIRNTQP